jgi:transposase
MVLLRLQIIKSAGEPNYSRQWRNDSLWRRINDTLRDQVRRKAKRKRSPSMGNINTQSSKTTEQGGPRGKAFDYPQVAGVAARLRGL